MAKNLLFLMADQLGAHALDGESQEFLAAPHLARLREEGAAFDRAYTPFPLCVPGRSSLISGRAPHEIGIDRNRPSQEVVEEFRAARRCRGRCRSTASARSGAGSGMLRGSRSPRPTASR